MTYYVSVTVTNQFYSEQEAREFSDKVLESTKGQGEYDRSIRYVKPQQKLWNGTTYIVNNHNPQVTTTAEAVSQRITKAAQQGQLRDGE